ncbi:MAG: proline dehydrogenase [Burkholderiales bacterium]|nr:proline dehydrogenase [Burkholderiales bacterium]
MRQLATLPLRLLLQLAGRAYVPGWTLDAVRRRAGTLAATGAGCTLGYFNPPGRAVPAVAAECLAIVDTVAGLQPAGYLSIKAPAFGFDAQAMAPVLAHARARGVHVHFDSHDIASAGPTLHCLAQAAGQGGSLGLTLPGRWPRSLDDAEMACALGVRPRIVKGEWPDPAHPRADARAGFLALVERLAGRVPELAVATHDPALAHEALARLQAAGTRCELELLHGLPRRAPQQVADALGVPVRLYLPYGMPWRPYALRKLGENPRIAWWLLKDSVLGACQQWGRRDAGA